MMGLSARLIPLAEVHQIATSLVSSPVSPLVETAMGAVRVAAIIITMEIVLPFVEITSSKPMKSAMGIALPRVMIPTHVPSTRLMEPEPAAMPLARISILQLVPTKMVVVLLDAIALTTIIVPPSAKTTWSKRVKPAMGIAKPPAMTRMPVRLIPPQGAQKPVISSARIARF